MTEPFDFNHAAVRGGCSSSWHRRVGLLLATTTLFGLLAGLASAQSLLSANVGGNVQTAPSGTAQSSGGSAFGTHAATARYGSLSVGSAIAIPSSGSDSGLLAIASFQDDVTVTDPVATGGGTIRAQLRILGTPTYSASRTSPAVSQSATASYQVLRLQNGGSFSFEDGTVLYNTGTVPEETILGTVPAPGLVEVEFPFVFGFPVNIGMQLTGSSSGNNIFFPSDDGSVSASSNTTLEWLGIVSIEDSGGVERAGTATVTSASGTDWTAPAPAEVPVGPWVPLGVGVALVALGTRRLDRWATRERVATRP